MNILMIAPHNSPHSTRPLRWLLDAGHAVFFMSCENPFPGSSSSNYHYLSALPYDEDMAVFCLKKIVDSARIDLVHVHWIDTIAYHCVLADVHPLVLSAWGSDINAHFTDNLSTAVASDKIGETLRGADMIVTDAPGMPERLARLAGEPVPTIDLHLGIDINLFKPDYLLEALAWRNALEIPPEATVLFSPRVMNERYHHTDILVAYANALPFLNHETCLLFKLFSPDIEYVEALKRKATDLNIMSHLRFINDVAPEKLPQLYALSNIIINAPHIDTLPITLIEAAVCGKEVITCDHPTYNSSFIDNYPYIFPLNEWDKLTNHIVSAVNSPDDISERLDKIRQETVAAYDEKNYIKGLLSCYEALIKKEHQCSDILTFNNSDQSSLRILCIAFIDQALPQIINKIDQQYKTIRSFAPGSRSIVIGSHFEATAADALAIECKCVQKKPGESGVREECFEIANQLVEEFSPDIIYFRYPFFDFLTLDFVRKHHNVVFELQTIAEFEVDEIESFVERNVAPQILQHAAGVVAVTPEILEHELRRSPRALSGHVMSNGICTDSLPLAKQPEMIDTLHLLCVAFFERWQGYDRLLAGLSNYKGPYRIIVHFVGTGPELVKYYDLADRLLLLDNCIFHGQLDSNQISELADQCHVAVGTLALHRKGITQFCGLKNREYCLRGMPFVYAGVDTDFSENLPFLRVVPMGESPLDITKIVELGLYIARNPQVRLIERQYATENLSWEKRIKILISFFEDVHNSLLQNKSAAGLDVIPAKRNGRILLTTYGWRESGGGTTFPRAVALELTRRGYEVAVFYASLKSDPSMPSYSIEISSEDGVRLYGVYNRPALFTDPDNPEREICDLAIVQRFREVLDEFKPNVIHFNNFHGLTFAIAEEAHIRGIPSCYTPHNYHVIDPDLYLFNSGLSLWSGVDLLKNSEAVTRNPHKRSLYQQRISTSQTVINKWVDVTLAVSTRQRELLIQYGAVPQRIAVVHQANSSTDLLWRETAVEHELHKPLQVGFIGGIMPQKGVHLLIAAAQALKPEEAQFHLYGCSSSPEYFDQLLKLDKSNLVTFHGAYTQAELPEIASRLDIAVVPSVGEDCAPLVVLELHAMRLPVIGARIGGIPDFISDGVDGRLYPHHDLGALIEILREFVDSPERLEAMRRNLAAPMLTFAQYMDHLETIYLDLSSGTPLNAAQYTLTVGRRVNAITTENKVAIHWQGGLFVHHSLALVNRELCLQLLDKGYSISFESTIPDQFQPEGGSRLDRLASIRNLPIKQPDVTVRHFWAPDFSRPVSGKLVVIQPWEYGSIPAAWVGQINRNVDQLWVPSNFVRNCYLKDGVEADRVQVAPNGVAVERFNPQAAPLVLPTSKGFRFLFVGGTIHRKGIDLLLAAYAAAFTAADDVCLVIKEMGSTGIYQGQTAQEMIAAFQQVALHPELLYLQDDISDTQMPSLYRACHCLVHPYRGEGFGLPIAEAMACGLAPIVTGYGAALDFCPPEIAWLIPAVEQPLSEKRISTLETVDYPWLAEPVLDALTALLRHAYSNQEEVFSRGQAAAEHIRERFSWQQAAAVADRLLQNLVAPHDALSSNPLKPVVSEIELIAQRRHKSCARAYALAGRGEIEQAVQLLLEEGIRLDSAAAEPYCALAEILLTAGRCQDALEVIVEMPPSVDPAYRCELEVMAACALGEDEQALQLAVKVAARPRVQVALGTMAARRGGLADAEQCFRQALTQDPGCASALLSLGMLLWGQGQHQQAWQAVQQAVSADPLQEAGLSLLSEMAHRLARLPEATALLGQVVEQFPLYRIPARCHAVLLAESGQQTEALAAVEAFLALFGMDDDLLELGLALRRQQGPRLVTAALRKPTVSLCMIVKNEELFLAQCLQSVKAVVDELVLLDTGSTDRTVALATLFGARVGRFDWTGSFSEARNAVLKQAKGDWILVMDADERISPQDHQALLVTLQQSAGTDAWSVLIRTYSNRVQVQGWTTNDGSYPAEEQADGWYPASRVRLFPNHPGICYEGMVHELLEPSLRRLGFTIRTAPFVAHHYAEVTGLPENLRAKQLRYYELGRQKLVEQPENLSALFELAVQAGELELYDDALLLWDRLLALCPGQLDALFNKGHVLMALRRYQEALQVSRRVLDADPDNREALFNYGTCELYVGDVEKACTLVAARLAKDRSYPLLLALQTMLGLATGRIAEACCCYAELVAQQYDIQGYLAKRLATLQDLGRHGLVTAIRTAAQTARLSLPL